jgi:hypothetical protein
MINFHNKAKSNLTKYKKEHFPGLADGRWKKNNKPYSHILPEENKSDNLLPTYKNEFIDYLDKNDIKLHSDFHHLNSSQAMCFNFFFPLYREQKLEYVTDLLGLRNDTVNYNTVCFEKDGLEVEYDRRPTSFDFYFETKSGKKIYFEIKYTEYGFGKGKINLKKYEEVYSKYLRPLNSKYRNPQKFFDNYQILRNLIHISKNSFVVFVYPKGNNLISSEAIQVKTEYLTQSIHSHYYAITWEKLLENVPISTINSKLRTQLIDFKQKYLFENSDK